MIILRLVFRISSSGPVYWVSFAGFSCFSLLIDFMLLRTCQQPHWIEGVERGFHCGGDCPTFGGTTSLRRFGELDE